MAEKKYVYSFKEAHAAHLGKDILGGKGAGLCEMTAAGVNIPAGFTITTEACTLYYDSGRRFRILSGKTSLNIFTKSKKSMARPSAPKMACRFWSPFVPALVNRCRA